MSDDNPRALQASSQSKLPCPAPLGKGFGLGSHQGRPRTAGRETAPGHRTRRESKSDGESGQQKPAVCCQTAGCRKLRTQAPQDAKDAQRRTEASA